MGLGLERLFSKKKSKNGKKKKFRIFRKKIFGKIRKDGKKYMLYDSFIKCQLWQAFYSVK